MGIPVNEIKQRKEKIVKYLNDNLLDAFMILDPYNIFYMGFYHVVTERPVAYIIYSDGKVELFVPMLEKDEATRVPNVDSVKTYFEYPGKKGVFEFIGEELKFGNNTKKIGVDNTDFKLFKKLSGVFEEVKVSDVIYDMRIIKSPYEIELLKSAGYYSDYAVSAGFEALKLGVSELEILSELEKKTTEKMIDELDEVIYVPGGPIGALLPTGWRTALPHGLPSNRKVEKGDTVMLSCGANVKGYRTETERTCFVGEPSKDKIKAFNVIYQAQKLATTMMVPGKSCSEIDRTVMDFIRENGYGDYIRHRTGHGKGLGEHETPWVDEGDPTIIKPGMVLSSEPGIYIEGLSGFRHSDTVAVTDGEPLLLTKYSKKLEDLIVYV